MNDTDDDFIYMFVASFLFYLMTYVHALFHAFLFLVFFCSHVPVHIHVGAFNVPLMLPVDDDVMTMHCVM